MGKLTERRDTAWILDGFPRSNLQLDILLGRGDLLFPPIVYLSVTQHQAERRALLRARLPIATERHRIQTQSAILASIKNISACVIQTGWRTQDEVFRAAVDWLELETQPRDTP